MESSLRAWPSTIRHRAGVVKEYGPAPLVVGSESRPRPGLPEPHRERGAGDPEGNIEGNTIRVAIRTDAKGMVIVEISDTGAGIKTRTS